MIVSKLNSIQDFIDSYVSKSRRSFTTSNNKRITINYFNKVYTINSNVKSLDNKRFPTKSALTEYLKKYKKELFGDKEIDIISLESLNLTKDTINDLSKKNPQLLEEIRRDYYGIGDHLSMFVEDLEKAELLEEVEMFKKIQKEYSKSALGTYL